MGSFNLDERLGTLMEEPRFGPLHRIIPWQCISKWRHQNDIGAAIPVENAAHGRAGATRLGWRAHTDTRFHLGHMKHVRLYICNGLTFLARSESSEPLSMSIS